MVPASAGFKYQLQIPPYANPLSAASDPRAWWSEHRPLVLQTAALGPLKVLDDFAAFRVLSVKNDVIDRIHFVPIGRKPIFTSTPWCDPVNESERTFRIFGGTPRVS